MDNNYLIRELEYDDIKKGLRDTLDALTAVGDIDPKKWNVFWNLINKNENHKIFVYVQDNKVVGSVTCLIEPKIIHEMSFVAHIEDVATHKDYQGKGIAKKLIDHALDHAKNRGVYKIILHCTQELVPFYEKFGFIEKNIGMRKDL